MDGCVRSGLLRRVLRVLGDLLAHRIGRKPERDDGGAGDDEVGVRKDRIRCFIRREDGVSGPRPDAIARAIAAVLPQWDS